MATESEIQQIKDRTDLLELVGRGVKLKRSGRNFVGLCPFHAEKTPSFFVSPERGTWHCFGCNRHGDAFTFLMERENLNFGEALKVLADRVGVKLTRRISPEKQNRKERLLAINSLAAEFYHYLLTTHRLGWRARAYLQKRDISPASIKKFRLGYAPDSWRTTSQYLLKKGYSAEELVQAGLAINRSRSDIPRRQSRQAGSLPIYDRFRGRLMFPVWDNLGRVVGFSARTLKKEEQVAKYINSPQSPIFQKGRLFYGLTQARDKIREQGHVLLVEGNLDVISLHQADLEHSVASLGTALTVEHLKLIKRFTRNLTLVFDADEGGEKATLRTVDLAFGTDLELLVARPSLGKDPDEAVRKDLGVFQKDLAAALPAFDYLIKLGEQKFELASTAGQRALGQFILPFIAKVESAVVKESYVKKIAGVLGVSEKSVWSDLERLPNAIGKEKHRAPLESSLASGAGELPGPRPRPILVAEHFLSLVFNSPDLLWSDPDFQEPLFNVSTRFFPDKGLREIWRAFLEDFLKSPKVDLARLGANLDQSLQKRLDLLILSPFVKIPEEADEYLEGLMNGLNELKKTYWQSQAKKLAQKIRKAEEKSDPEQVDKLRKRLRKVTQKIAAL